MHFILILMMQFHGDGVAMQEFNTKDACDNAIQQMPGNWRAYFGTPDHGGQSGAAYCVPKG